ncbi:MAG: hypothetical protein U0M20_07005 [Christensenellales bacterium]|nr:hypothetical protein [Christensenellales bacterium]
MGKLEGGTVNEKQIENDKNRFGDFINRPVRISHQSSVLCFEQAKHGERCQHFLLYDCCTLLEYSELFFC